MARIEAAETALLERWAERMLSAKILAGGVLRLGDAAEGVGEPHEDAGADEAAHGGGEVGALVAKRGGLDEVLGDAETGVEEAIADGEVVIAGQLGAHPASVRRHAAPRRSAAAPTERCGVVRGSGPRSPALTHLRAGTRIHLSLSAMQSAYSKCIAAGELVSTPPWASWTGLRS